MSEVEKKFVFTKENLQEAKKIISKYPDGRQKSAVLPLLTLAQEQNNGWLSVATIEYVADYISEPYMRVYEVVSFYTMYNLKPVGKYHIQVCGTTPCWLRGSNEIMQICEREAKTKCGTTSEDKMFTISEVECLGACVNAPMVQINDDYHENLDKKRIEQILKDLRKEENNANNA